jgi:hypothetical protein
VLARVAVCYVSNTTSPRNNSGGIRTTVNRKLIRPTLADMKVKRDAEPPRARVISGGARILGGGGGGGERSARPSLPGKAPMPARPPAKPMAPPPVQVPQAKKRQPPPSETHAELYYYKKQIDSHTPMIIVLQDNEEIEGTIEWYDKSALKVNRKDAPNVLLLKHNIKYMFKVEDRESGQSEPDDE